MTNASARALTLIVGSLLAACSSTPSRTPESPPQGEDCYMAQAFATEQAEIHWPVLLPPIADTVSPGDELEIQASGGHLRWESACGELIDESARDFVVFFDEEPAGNISCYVNVCLTVFIIPPTALPGIHTLTVEGGSSMEIEVIGP